MTNTTSKHILHTAKKRIIPSSEISQIYDIHDGMNSFIGALPPEIITQIPKEKKKDVTKRADFIFSVFSRSVAYVHVDSHVHYSLNEEHFKSYFPQITSELNKLFNRNDISISYIGSGTYKHCFMLSFGKGTQNRYVLQTFQNVVNIYKDHAHGSVFEPQNCFTAYTGYSHGRIAKPFMSHPSNKEILSGAYIVAKYIDNNHAYKKPIGKFLQRRTRVLNTDVLNTDNTIRGITIDAGGFIKNPEHITAPQTRYHWHELAQILDNINLSINDKNIYMYLYKKYIKYGNKFFDTWYWPRFIKKSPTSTKDKTSKILKSLRRLKLKCEKLSVNPDWKIVQNYIIQDMRVIYPHDYQTQTIFPEIIFDIINTNQR